MALGACADKDPEIVGKRAITIRVSDFAMSFEGGQAKTSAAEATDRITVAVFNAAGNSVFSETQQRADSAAYDTYGVFDLTLNDGVYTLVAVGYRTLGTLSITSPTTASFTGGIPDCYVGTQTLTVGPGNNGTIAMTLNRPVARFSVCDTLNPFPASVYILETRFSSGSSGFNPTTGFAISNTGYTRSMYTSSITYVHPNFNYHIFLNAESQSMDVTITCRDSEGHVNYQKTIPSVPLRRNYATRAVGPLFGTSAATSFTFNTTFAGDTSIAF